MRPVAPDHEDITDGHREVIALFERALAQVKKRPTRFAAVVMCESPTHADMEYAGSTGCEFAANWAYDTLKLATLRTPPPVAVSLGADFACYDLQRAPFSFDFFAWLIERDMHRARSGAPAPLKVAFVDPPKDRPMTPYNHLMFGAIMIPGLELLGAVVDSRAANQRSRVEYYCFRPIVEAALEGEKVPLLKPRDSAMEAVAQALIGRGRPPITITLREAPHNEYRNSNTEAWMRFAGELRDAGERVIFVRDTEKADEPIPGFEIFPQASRDLHMRQALYEQAKCNLFVPNGPWTLALFGTKPWLLFSGVSDDAAFHGNTPSCWINYHGVAPGNQFPWSRPEQRIVWQHDDYDSIRAAWNDLAPMLEQAVAA